MKLLENVAATGSAAQWNGGRGAFALAGTVSGATITLQYLGPDGSTWLTVPNCALTAVGMVLGVELPPGKVRCLVASGTPSGLYASLERSSY
jgi:hypothetical protein